MRKTAARSMAIAAAIAACGGSKEPAPRPASESDRLPREAAKGEEVPGLSSAGEIGTGPAAIDLRFQVRARSGDGARAIAPGDALESGDRIEMLVSLEQAAYLYVAQRFADGGAAVLFPDAGDHRLEPGERHRIPQGEAWFELDDTQGEEHIFVVASRQPLAEVATDIARQLDLIRVASGDIAGEGAGPGLADPDAEALEGGKKGKPKSSLALASRGTSVLIRGGDGPTVRGRADPEGVLVFTFWFPHR